VLRRTPGLRQASLAEQLAQPLRVRAVGLGATLAAPQRAGLDRLGQVRDRAGLLERLADKQPAGARLDSDVHKAAREPGGPLLDRPGR